MMPQHSFTNRVNCGHHDTMTVAFNNTQFRPVRFKSKVSDCVYHFDTKMHGREYIALPRYYGEERITFQRSIRLVLFIGQCFGLCPVLGICSDKVNDLRFNYSSGRCLYSFLTMILQGVLVCFSILKIFWEVNASLNSNSAVVFFGSNSVITILFFNVARKWARLSRNIAKMEAVDPNTDKHLVLKCNITCIVFLTTGAVEHCLSVLSDVSIILACQPDRPALESYLINSFYWVWAYVPYNTFFGCLAKFVGIQCTFNWNYSDTFIMCICLYLNARIKQINDRINVIVSGQTAPPNFWRTMREDYTKATDLVRQVDEIVSAIVLVSFGSNLFSLCFLFLHTLEDGLKPSVICDVPSNRRLLSGYEHTTYYLFSIGFLIVRSLAMSLIAARVNLTSIETAHALYDVPDDLYNEEVQRLIDQIHGDSVALSGLKFFSVKRGIVLSIAAAIVTYELVLIQFSGIDPAPSIKSN